MKKTWKLIILDFILLIFFAIATYFFYNMLPSFITKIFFPYEKTITELLKLVTTTYLLWYLFYLLFLKHENNFYVTLTMLYHLIILLFFLFISNKAINNFLIFLLFFTFTLVLSYLFYRKLNFKVAKKYEKYSLLVFPILYIIFILI